MSQGQLVRVVSATPNTVAEEVLKEMRRLYLSASAGNLELTFECSGAPRGLFLESCFNRAGTYSLKYRQVGDVLYLPIGVALPADRLGHVASSILAMIKRGKTWTATNKEGKEIVFSEGYGQRREVRPVNDSWRNRRRRYPDESVCRIWCSLRG